MKFSLRPNWVLQKFDPSSKLVLQIASCPLSRSLIKVNHLPIIDMNDHSNSKANYQIQITNLKHLSNVTTSWLMKELIFHHMNKEIWNVAPGLRCSGRASSSVPKYSRFNSQSWCICRIFLQMRWQIKDATTIKAVHTSTFCCILMIDEKFLWGRTSHP